MDKHLFKCKFRKGDEVIVTAGKNKGQKGAIDRIDRKNGRVFIAGVNIIKRAIKPSELYPSGGFLDKPGALDISNIALIDPQTKKPTRIGYRIENGAKVRFAKRSGKVI